MTAGSVRTFNVPSSTCGIPASAAAYSLNVTVVPQGLLRWLTLWPSGQTQPLASTLNSSDGQVIANAAIVPAGTDGAVSVFVTNNTDVILDINGYFAPQTSPRNNNTAVGAQAGVQVSTGTNNIFIGFEAGANVKTGNQNVYIANGSLDGNDESNVIRIGSPGNQTRTFIAGIGNSIVSGSAVLIDPATGQLGASLSSERYKQDIRNMGDASDKLMQLRPVTFHYKQAPQSGNQPLQYGLIAEEVSKVYPELVVYGKEGQVESVQYHQLPALLLNEVQKQHRRIELQQTRIDEQTEIIKDMKVRISDLERMIHVQASANHLP